MITNFVLIFLIFTYDKFTVFQEITILICSIIIDFALNKSKLLVKKIKVKQKNEHISYISELKNDKNYLGDANV